MIPLSALLLATVLLALAFTAQSPKEQFTTPYTLNKALAACKKARLGKSTAHYD